MLLHDSIQFFHCTSCDEELKKDFPEARNKELRRDQFEKILREEKERIKEANTIDLTADDDLPTKKQRKMTDFLKKVPFT